VGRSGLQWSGRPSLPEERSPLRTRFLAGSGLAHADRRTAATIERNAIAKAARIRCRKRGSAYGSLMGILTMNGFDDCCGAKGSRRSRCGAGNLHQTAAASLLLWECPLGCGCLSLLKTWSVRTETQWVTLTARGVADKFEMSALRRRCARASVRSLLICRNPPRVAGGILNASDAVAPGHIGWLSDRLGARLTARW
jgi:hypothetical protein